MKQSLTYDGYLNIGKHKSINVTSTLRIEVIPDDEWSVVPTNYNSSEYLNGVKIEGELYFESFPIKNHYQNGSWQSHHVKKGVLANLSLHKGEEVSRFQIVLLENVSEISIVRDKVVRYYWTFLPIGNPLSDKLGIFPEQYRWNNQMNRVYFCKNFRGVHWPEEVASIVVAPDKKKARQLLDAELKILKIEKETYDLIEIDTSKEKAVILVQGH
jgi:hypothetical protein